MQKWRKKLWIAISIVFVLYLCTSSFFFIIMGQPPATISKVFNWTPFPVMMLTPFRTMWNVARGGCLEPGDMAPEFSLRTDKNDAVITLSQFRGKKPVVLIFGSYT